MKRIIHPPLDAHNRLRQPLTAGEQAVLSIFDQCLSPGWEIYIQPHLNGLRPDFVLLNPQVGIAVFEVKDWNLDAMRYFWTKDRNGVETLWAERDGKAFCIQADNPIPKVRLYRQEIYELYCPRLGYNSRPGRCDGWGAITAGVIFPFAAGSRVEPLLAPFLPKRDEEDYARYAPISGTEAVAAADLRRIFPESQRAHSRLMTNALADDLRGWLVEPDFSSTQREPLMLDRRQRSLAETRTETGYRRIKGPAGSGKSLVLAARAARLMNEGKQVLVVTFNITLWHYLRDLMVRGIDSPQRMNNVCLMHFHYWCKHVCYEAGWDARYHHLVRGGGRIVPGQRQVLLDDEIPALASEAVEQPGATKYDAILVDEGQDFHPHWWSALRKALVPGGEMMLVADATQDVYGTAKAWTDEVMQGAGFRGGWAQLDVSYRLPPAALKMAREFAQRFLPAETAQLPESEQGDLNLYPCTLRWVQCDKADATSVCADEFLALMRLTGRNGLANADITLLSEATSVGAKVSQLLEDRFRIRTLNTFSADNIEQRRQKMGFFMGDARVKATTLHSFKGWETRLLVIYVDAAADPKALALVYAGLTRLKRHTEGSWLTVVCSARELEAFGQTWPSYARPAVRRVNPGFGGG
ncbi:AAA family ATPase [Corallococcus terminator]|uniref:DNA 3'-5' helicase II n=1 Tax=Corallococcus terminator TaxID=2316733 RepID=A0A3A8I4W3_9BACT|nr:AAA family ATPase [Corallococcus terminator]RKG72683.1 DNA helicase [Corallococcus terminator]